jgi:hypothetical protein
MSREHRPLIDTNMPPDEKLQAAVGRVVIRHGQLDHTLRMLLKSIDDITLEEAWSRTRSMTSGLLGQCVRRAAKAALGEADAFKQLDALLVEAAGATDERNKLMHALWDIGGSSEQQYRPRGGPREAVPTVLQLDALASRLEVAAEQLNDARRHGFLKEAIEQKRPAKR